MTLAHRVSDGLHLSFLHAVNTASTLANVIRRCRNQMVAALVHIPETHPPDTGRHIVDLLDAAFVVIRADILRRMGIIKRHTFAL